MECIDTNEKVYLTSNLFYIPNSDECYYEENQRKNKININNWHKFFNEYGWAKIDIGWIRRLNTYIEKKEKNSRWGILDCNGNGDCLFSVISESLNYTNLIKSNSKIYNVKDIRELTAMQINENNFNIIIESYKLEFDCKEFSNGWNPHDIKNYRDLQNELIKEGNNYWGDYIVLQLLQEALNIHFIILNSEKLDNEGNKIRNLSLHKKYTVHSTASNIDNYKQVMILYYIDEVHFQLVGYFNGNIINTIFDKNCIPKELMKVYRIDCNK